MWKSLHPLPRSVELTLGLQGKKQQKGYSGGCPCEPLENPRSEMGSLLTSSMQTTDNKAVADGGG